VEVPTTQLLPRPDVRRVLRFVVPRNTLEVLVCLTDVRSDDLQLQSAAFQTHHARTSAAAGGAHLSTSPVANVEAMARERPVVALRISGLGHLVERSNALIDDRTGGTGLGLGALSRLHDCRFRRQIREDS
jgi:hypothetical protein